MKRFLAAMLAAMVVSGPLAAAAHDLSPSPGNPAQPFESVPLPPPPNRSHRGSHVAFLMGVALVAGSFTLSDRANRAYDRYLDAETEPEIERWFDESQRYDRWSSGALLGGEGLVATGVYLRFLRRPSSPLSLVLASRTCAVSLRF
jgi:hypothetical protein